MLQVLRPKNGSSCVSLDLGCEFRPCGGQERARSFSPPRGALPALRAGPKARPKSGEALRDRRVEVRDGNTNDKGQHLRP